MAKLSKEAVTEFQELVLKKRGIKLSYENNFRGRSHLDKLSTGHTSTILR